MCLLGSPAPGIGLMHQHSFFRLSTHLKVMRSKLVQIDRFRAAIRKDLWFDASRGTHSVSKLAYTIVTVRRIEPSERNTSPCYPISHPFPFNQLSPIPTSIHPHIRLSLWCINLDSFPSSLYILHFIFRIPTSCIKHPKVSWPYWSSEWS